MPDDVRSSVAQFLGGPGTFSGTNFQLDVAVLRTLQTLERSRRRAAPQGHIRAEPREIADGGQTAFDVFVADGDNDDFWEVKREPGIGDVCEFVALAAGTDDVSGARLVAGRPTAAFTSLGRFVAHIAEATDLDHLRRLVAASNDTRQPRLLDAAGPDVTMDRLVTILPPDIFPVTWVRDQVDRLSDALSDGGGPVLADEVRRRLREAMEVRGSIGLADLTSELLADGRLAQPAAASLGGDDLLLNALGLIQALPEPVPLPVLAAWLGVDDTEADHVVGRLIEARRVAVLDGTVTAVEPLAVAEPADPHRLAQSLSRLLAMAEAGDVAPAQTLNARNLAERLLDDRPGLVAEVFPVFDKISKEYGDLGVVESLALISVRACFDAEAGATETQRRTLAEHRARTIICGTGWVLQRVGELDRASEAMAEAAAAAAYAQDPRNSAFAVKCLGRLDRLIAERLDVDDPDRAGMLRRSADQLEQAIDDFAALVAQQPDVAGQIAECHSLLARSLAVAGDFNSAARHMEVAYSRLDGVGHPDKVVLDLELLEVEFELFRDGTSDPDRLREMAAITAGLIGHYDGGHPSELAGRVHALTGRLLGRAGDVDDARRHYAAAIDHYRGLGHSRRAWELEWLHACVAPDELPAELMEVLEQMQNMTDAGRLRSLTQYRTRAKSGPVPADELQALVTRAHDAAVAFDQPWAAGDVA